MARDKKTTRKTASADPHFERESAKYENPIPSREFILEFMKDKGQPLPFAAVLNGLGLYSDDHEIALSRRLGAMSRDGQLLQNRRGLWCLPEKMDLRRGRVQGHRDGYGFVALDEGGADWVIPQQEMRKVLPGDRVLVAAKGTDRKGRTEAQIVQVIEEAERLLVGRFQQDRGVSYVAPSDPRVAQDFIIAPGDDLGAKPDQIVVFAVTQRGHKHLQPLARVVEVLGDHLAPGMEVQIAIRTFDLPDTFSDAVLREVGDLSPQVRPEDSAGRIDLRKLPLVTIDGEDARDFDDAVYCERKKSGGWRLWVAIADVSHYVRPGTALDREAENRGNSVYFPGFVIPMLPELLSNGLCSLNPDVDRLCMVCEMTVSEAGSLSSYRFYPAVMRSHSRFTYTRVWDLLNGAAPQSEREQQLLPALRELHALYGALAEARQQRGGLELDSRETKVIFNSERKIEKIVPVTRNDAHRLIEECMILANVASARYLNKQQMPALYRVHQGTNQRKLDTLREQLAVLRLSLGGGDEPSPKDYAQLLAKIAQRPDADAIQTLLLRSLTQAVYQSEMEPHFGLALNAYTHFTSPIRRYPDLVVHRALKAVLEKSEPVPVGCDSAVHYQVADLDRVGAHCSMTERRADEATRDVVNWLKCEFMEDKLGEVFDGTVTGVVGFGLFVELDEVFVEGLVHVSTLRNDYYHFDQARSALVGERGGQVFRLGDRLQVRVANVDLDQRQIDFHYLGRAETREPDRENDLGEEDIRARRLQAIRKAMAREGASTRDLDEKMRADDRRAGLLPPPARSRPERQGQERPGPERSSRDDGHAGKPGRRSGAGKPASTGGRSKSAAGKSGGGLSSSGKSSGGKSAGGKSAGGKPASGKSAGRAAGKGKSAAGKSPGKKRR